MDRKRGGALQTLAMWEAEHDLIGRSGFIVLIMIVALWCAGLGGRP